MTYLVVILVATPTTLAVATTLAGLFGALSPLVLRWVPTTGLPMSTVSYALALLIAVVAAMITGELHPDGVSVVAVLSGSAGVWTVQQAVFVALKQWAPERVGVPAKGGVVPGGAFRS